MELVIISGRSGSGKTTALRQLEDEDYYCIDNLPVALLPSLIEQTSRDDFSRYRGVAICIDARNTRNDLDEFGAIVDSLQNSVELRILFLDADDEELIKRYSETRRRHPLGSDDIPLVDAIKRERELLEPIAQHATLILDTSQLTIYELRDAIKQRLLGTGAGGMSLLIQSFGFKRGVPSDSDLVFDARMLPNPHWDRELRELTGLDTGVREFLESKVETAELFESIRNYLDRWLPAYAKSNRSYLTVSIGCTGGKHRSVYLADRLFRQYQQQFPQVHLRHRELQ